MKKTKIQKIIQNIAIILIFMQCAAYFTEGFPTEEIKNINGKWERVEVGRLEFFLLKPIRMMNNGIMTSDLVPFRFGFAELVGRNILSVLGIILGIIAYFYLNIIRLIQSIFQSIAKLISKLKSELSFSDSYFNWLGIKNEGIRRIFIVLSIIFYIIFCIYYIPNLHHWWDWLIMLPICIVFVTICTKSIIWIKQGFDKDSTS